MVQQTKQHGFTLIELLTALMVGAVVMAAAATMAEAMSCGKRETENITRSANYLAHLHTRLSDLVMRAERISELDEAGKTGVALFYPEEVLTVYTDSDQQIIYVHQSGQTPYAYDYIQRNHKTHENESVQKNVQIQYDDSTRVIITFTLNDTTYTMTAARRGGT